MTLDRVAPTLRASCPPERSGVQRWRTLLFVHWEVDAAVLRPLVPAGLTLDTFEGRAFVGLVPFTMEGIRLAWAPPVPGTRRFHETNIRTYVHAGGKDPGVWFFSLDAASSLAVRVARAFFHLPYFRARMELDVQSARISYRSARLWPAPVPATLALDATIGEALPHAAPGTLEHFLAERYVLYAEGRGRLHRGRVHHSPYPLRAARVDRMEQTLLDAAGLPGLGAGDSASRARGPCSVLYSPGVDVDIFPIDPIAPLT
jgi:uncharacterized protein YqjF (DUF2071 family)